jgi:hypothetical protein
VDEERTARITKKVDKSMMDFSQDGDFQTGEEAMTGSLGFKLRLSKRTVGAGGMPPFCIRGPRSTKLDFLYLQEISPNERPVTLLRYYLIAISNAL